MHSHLASTFLGEVGTTELITFGRRIGLRERWLQHRGEDKEHFDVFDSRIQAALDAGASVLEMREFIQIVVRSKREASATHA